MRFSQLIGKHEGARIGVLGSAPSLEEYKSAINSECDIVIGCNGALMSLDPDKHVVDYFIYYDARSFTRQWFCREEPFHNRFGSKVTRVLPTYMLPFDPNVLESKNDREQLLDDLKKFKELNPAEEDIVYFNPDISKMKLEGVAFRVCDLNLSFVNRHDGPMCRRSTITGIGSQLAYKMGAKRINLFGCEFDNPLGNERYSYDNQMERGQIRPNQIQNMDLILGQISNSGVEIISFGKTKLSAPKIIY